MIYKNKRNTRKTYTPENIITWRYKTGNQLIPYNKPSMIRSACGVVSIGVGIITCFIPFTTIPLVALGSYLLGFDGKIVISNLIYKSRLIFDWLYCNRTPKRLLKSFKMRWLGWN